MISLRCSMRKRRNLVFFGAFCIVIIPDHRLGSRSRISKGHGINNNVIYQLPDRPISCWRLIFIPPPASPHSPSGGGNPNWNVRKFPAQGGGDHGVVGREYPAGGREVAKAEGSGIWGQPSPDTFGAPLPKGE